MENVLNIIKNTNLDYKQKRAQLASAAENSLPYVKISKKAEKLLNDGVINNLNEGNAPYRPRYILPDYKKYITQGSEFLNVAPPKDMYEAINAMLIAYSYVPSVTGYPVYLGDIDEVLEPFADTVGEKELYNLMKMFLINIDRTLPDAFVHMDMGPKDTKVGRLVLKLEKELKKAVPNVSLKISGETPDELVKLAVETGLEVGKPYFIDHESFKKELGENYSVASCYNTLKIGGGSYTLVRLNLKKAAELSKDFDDFMNSKLPEIMDAVCEVVDARIRFIVEEVKFFENSFLAREGLIDMKNFTAMPAVFGLYECVEVLSGGLKLGHSTEADDMGEKILQRCREIIKSKNPVHCPGFDNKYSFHAQSGIDTDLDVTAGVRIKIGEEPDIFSQIKTEGRFQKYFDSGVSDIYIFDKTAKNNIDGVFKIIKGAFKNGVRELNINTNDSDLIRITGYLVKRSDVEKYLKGEQLREQTVQIAGDSINNNKVLNRAVRKDKDITE